MGAIKRKDPPSVANTGVKRSKTKNTEASNTRNGPLEEQARSSDYAFPGFPDESDDGPHVANEGIDERTISASNKTTAGSERPDSGPKPFKLETSSAEANAKQRALAKERKANKPNSDAIQRSKKIWERLRRKSHVPSAERKELVTELFSIITGRVHEFVFKHDSVRVIQCALKYANQEQRRQISSELAGSMRPLVESRYGKFLVAKFVQDKDQQIRDAVVPEFYGHVKRLINHPEAGWIVDDIYRQMATAQQKDMLLTEWYGAEFALFHKKPDAKQAIKKQADSADLSKILEKNPEKRKPILQYLLSMISGLIQKKMTGFTMLHDAMLQYFFVLEAGSSEHVEFLEILKGDIDPEAEGGGGDLYRNLSFTKSGHQLVCFALAYGTPKDRKTILRCFKDHVDLMAHDQHGKMVLVVGLDVPDDTKMSSKSILSELLGQGIEDETQRLDYLEQNVLHLHARVPILYSMAGMAKWLMNDAEIKILEEVHKIRETTSKKQPATRQQELLENIAKPVLELVTKRSESLVKTSFGCQFITEALLETKGADKSPAMEAVAQQAAGDPNEAAHMAQLPHAGRMLKALVLGGSFDPSTKTIRLVEPRLGFANVLYDVVKQNLLEWACGASSFVVVAFLESQNVSEDIKREINATLIKGKSRIKAVAGDGDTKKSNAGAKILMQHLK